VSRKLQFQTVKLISLEKKAKGLKLFDVKLYLNVISVSISTHTISIECTRHSTQL